MRLSERLRFFQEELFSFPTVGLDISDASFHMVRARRNKPNLYSIESAYAESIPEGIIEMGEIKKEKELAELLNNRLLKEKRITPETFIVASLPEEKAFIKSLQIPYIEDAEEMLNAVRFEAETNIPLPASEMYFDYEDATPRNKQLDHHDITIIAYPKKLVDSYIRVITQAGFMLAALELESQSLIRCLIDAAAPSEPTLIIDIGRTKSGFSIFSDQTIAFTSTLPLGGRDFEKSIQAALGVDPREAERVKKEVGLDPANEQLRNALQPIVSVIIDEAKKNIEFYETHPHHTHAPHRSISKIILCGGDAYLIGLSDELRERTGIAVEYGNPLRAFLADPHKGKGLTAHDALSFTTALGLAMRKNSF